MRTVEPLPISQPSESTQVDLPIPHSHPLLENGPLLHIMLPAGVVHPNVSKAFEAFVNRPRAPCPLNEAWHEGKIASNLSPLKRWAEDLSPHSPELIHIRVSDKTLMGKKWMAHANQVLRLAKRNLLAIRFRFLEEVVVDLPRQAAGKVVGGARELAVDLIDTGDSEYGYTADLGLDEVNRKKEVLQLLPYTVNAVDGDRREALGTCNITPEWRLPVPSYKCPTLSTSSKKHFLH